MKKFICSLIFILSAQVNASMIKIDIDNSLTAVGEDIQVHLLGKGLTEFDIFSFDLEYDTTAFSFDTASVSSDLIFADLFALPFPVFGFDVIESSFGLSFSLLPDFFTPMTYSGDILIASFSLSAKSAGDFVFNLNNSTFGLGFNPVDVETINSASVTVSDPSTIGILLMGCIFMAVRSRASL